MFPLFTVYHRLFAILLLIVRVTLISACEGECIVGITKALIGNYTTPTSVAFAAVASSLGSQILSTDKNHPVSGTPYLLPLLEEYNKRSYDHMEKAIFPGYFHGKCQDPVTGIEPAGCPNPSCPVVCGTPGSIVGHYSKFRYLAYSSTCDLWDEITAPNSTAYKKAEKMILADAPPIKERRLLRIMRNLESRAAYSTGISGRNLTVKRETQEDRVRAQSTKILKDFCSYLRAACGGDYSGNTNGLPRCSWRDDFTEYILTFP